MTTDTTTYPITITRDAFAGAGARLKCIGAFDAVAPGGVLAIADIKAHVALLAGPLAPYERWAVEHGLLPPIHAIAGPWGTAMAGAYGQATAGVGGRAMVGYRGTATVCDEGRATAGLGGTATAGEWGRIEIDWSERGRVRTAVGYIGETLDLDDAALAPDVAYKVDNKGRFCRA